VKNANIFFAFFIMFFLVFSGCTAKINKYNDLETAINNYTSVEKHKRGSSDQLRVQPNYIRELGICIENTENPTYWLTPGIEKKRPEKVTTEKLYENGSLMFTAKPNEWYGVTKPIYYDFTDVNIIAVAFYIHDHYAFDSVRIQLASTNDYGKSNTNNWERYVQASCGNTSTRLHRGWNYIKLHKDDFVSYGGEEWGIFRAIRFVVIIPPCKFNWDFTGMTDEPVTESKFGIGGIYLNPEYDTPKLMFNFDDSSVYMFRNAYPYLKEKNIKATLFVCYDHVRENGAGHTYMTEAQHDELYSSGWDIGNHSKTHRNLYELTEEENNKRLYCKQRLGNRSNYIGTAKRTK